MSTSSFCKDKSFQHPLLKENVRKKQGKRSPVPDKSNSFATFLMEPYINW